MTIVEDKRRKCYSCCATVRCISLLAVLSVVCIALGAGSIPFLNNFFKEKVDENLVLKKGSIAYNNWKAPPIPLYMEFYVFNYTNVDDIIQNGAKPNVVQLGPYTYKSSLVNVVLEEDDNNITYIQNYTYVYDETKSCSGCDENDIVTTPNLCVIIFLAMMKDKGYNESSPFIYKELMKTLNTLLNRDSTYTLFMSLTFKHLIWGYTSPFMKQLEGIINELKKILPKYIWEHFNLPDLNPNIRMQFNGTEGAQKIGNLTILTGKENIEDLQRIIRWQGKSKLDCWMSKYGNMLNGTDGTHAKPYLSRDEGLYMFNPNLYRSLLLSFDKTTSLYDISLDRYSTTDWVFASGKINSNNKAFCEPNKCYPSGLITMANCNEGRPPIFVSMPHFLHGDPKLWNVFHGLKPDKEKHDTFISVEPMTGIAMEAHIKFQINVDAMKVPFFTLTEALQSEDNFLPIMFFHEQASIDKKSADEIRTNILDRKKVMGYSEYSVIGFGGVLLVIALINFIHYKRRNRIGHDFRKLTEEESCR